MLADALEEHSAYAVHASPNPCEMRVLHPSYGVVVLSA